MFGVVIQALVEYSSLSHTHKHADRNSSFHPLSLVAATSSGALVRCADLDHNIFVDELMTGSLHDVRELHAKTICIYIYIYTVRRITDCTWYVALQRHTRIYIYFIYIYFVYIYFIYTLYIYFTRLVPLDACFRHVGLYSTYIHEC